MTTASPSPGLKELLNTAQLPALPQSAIRLLELSQNPDNGPAEFAMPIESDPGLTGQVLKFVNSSYFGFSREISSVKLAITLVGIRTIKNFALWSAVFSLMPNPKCGPFDLKSLWQDSLRRGLFARAFGKLLGLKDGEELFAASLLAGHGRAALGQRTAAALSEAARSRAVTAKPACRTWSGPSSAGRHAEAAGYMARHWSLPEEFAKLIESHTEIDRLMAENSKEIGKLSVALSALLPANHDEQWYEREKFVATFEKLAHGRGKSVADIFALIDAEFAEFAPVLKLGIPARSLVAHLKTEPAKA